MVDFSNVKSITIPEGEVKSITSNGVTLWELNESGLPSSYKQVEYVASSGTQYINTGVNANSNIKIEIEVIDAPVTSYNAVLYGGGDGWMNNYMQGELDTDATFAFKNAYYTLMNIPSAHSHILIQNKNKIYLDDVLKYTFGNDTFSTNYPIYLYAYNRGGNVGEYGSYKIGYCKIYNNDVLTADLIPCYRKSDNEIGFFDLVSREFLINSGTGTLIKGGDV